MEAALKHFLLDRRVRRIATTILAVVGVAVLLARPYNWFGYPVWRSGVETTLSESTPVAPSLARLVANRESGLADDAGVPSAKATRIRIEETATMPVRRGPNEEAREERFYSVRVVGGASDGYRGWIGENRLQGSTAR